MSDALENARNYSSKTIGLPAQAGLSVAAPFVRQVIRNGNLRIVCNGNASIEAGNKSGEAYVIRLSRPNVLFSILKSPDLRLGETFMNGEWRLDEGSLDGFLKMIMTNSPLVCSEASGMVVRSWSRTIPHKLIDEKESRHNARHHYDIGNDLYASFLDYEMNYSCAFFDKPDMTLEEAQMNKLKTTVSRMNIKPGSKVLDIGCGWGAMSRYLARNTKAASITGITLAHDQICYAFRESGFEHQDRLNYEIEDYREHALRHQGEYDRIVSIGMFEHVGTRQFRTFFNCIRRMLNENGQALIHTILRPDSGKPTSAWLDKYIFPGGCIPWMPDMLAAAYAEGMRPAKTPYIHDPMNYARTLRIWRYNFNRNWPFLDQNRYDERFYRMWNFYLASCEACFETLGFNVGQIVFEKVRS